MITRRLSTIALFSCVTLLALLLAGPALCSSKGVSKKSSKASTKTTSLSKSKEITYSPLITRLVKDGFDKKELVKLYLKKEVKFDVKTISIFFRHNEAKLNYDQFAKRKAIKRTLAYMEKYKTAFAGAQKKFDVDKNVIAAIILVETQLGSIVGRRLSLNVLSTMAALEEVSSRDILWRAIKSKSKVTRKELDQWSERKSPWAYKELVALLAYTKREKLEPQKIASSYAGAVGICQLMPSNILLFGQDGSGDGKVILSNHSDAIHSIAAYLKHYGWKPGLNEIEAGKVLFTYNHSDYYVKILQKVSKKLKGSK